jgi:hypothetical protein
VAVRTQQTEVIFIVILRISVNVINLKGYAASVRIDLAPATNRTLITTHIYKISDKMAGKILSIYPASTINLIVFPHFNIYQILFISLTFIRAICGCWRV